ncbi:hypothetical protein ACFC1W_08065 [Microbacterium sp. NPDC056003]|uniref:hypothetical protein n=1 Tax=Microbacterium sp. NPDC056003 TaxID=3345676 RepID=UPI0035E3A94A
MTALFGEPAAVIAGFRYWPQAGVAVLAIGLALFVWGSVVQRREQILLSGLADSDAVRVEIERTKGRLALLEYRSHGDLGLNSFRGIDRQIVKQKARLALLETTLEIAVGREAQDRTR